MFERQLDTLRRLGWASGGSEQLRELLAGRRPRQPLAFLTFDDGFADNATTALPLMLEYGMLPIVYVLPSYLDDAGAFTWPEVAARQRDHPTVMRSMDWTALDRIAEAGAEVGSHTLTHRSLTSLDSEELREALVDSRRRLRERYGRCDTLAYPFGHWSPRVAVAAADAGYSFAFTIPRDGQPPAGAHAIPRIAVDHRDDVRRFQAKLSSVTRRFLLSPLMPAARRVLR